MAAYGIDTLDPQVSTRRVHVLLERLPPWARMPGEAWSAEADLLALLVDHVANLTWITLKAYGSKNATRPRPVPRPPRRLLTPSRDGAAAPGPAAGREPGKAGSWMDAARMLAGMPGVVVRSDA